LTSRPPERIAYGEGPEQWGDLFLPDEPRGLVVVLHGGFWRARYRASLGEPLARDLAARGWAAYNLEYRRVGQGGGGAPGDSGTLDDVAAGIDALAEVPELSVLEASGAVTLGHSAGGQLAAWAAARGRYRRWSPVRVPVRAVVTQAGVLDLTRAYDEHLGDGAVRAFMGGPPGPDYDVADPQRQVPLHVPVRCVHGTADDVVPLHHSSDYVSAASAAGADATVVEVDGDHFAVNDVRTEAWTRIVEVLDSL
jgi:acetyl esterase/lipase